MLVEMGTIPCQGEEEPRLGHGQLCHGAPWGPTACGGTEQSRGITGLGSMGVQGRGAGGAVAEQHYAPTTAPTALLTASAHPEPRCRGGTLFMALLPRVKLHNV